MRFREIVDGKKEEGWSSVVVLNYIARLELRHGLYFKISGCVKGPNGRILRWIEMAYLVQV